MNELLKWLQGHKLATYTTAFLLMMVPCIPLYFAANAGMLPWMIFCLLLIAAGNLLATLVR